jgi:TfoX/Sxy family transcriptional regulator of competence genes
MKVPKPSDQAKERFRSVVPDEPGVEVKAMFGNLGAFVNGNMFAGLYGDAIGVKLIDAAAREELASIPGAGPFGPEDRPMGGYVSLPRAWDDQPSLMRPWVEAALAQVGTMPPKKAQGRGGSA